MNKIRVSIFLLLGSLILLTVDCCRKEGKQFNTRGFYYWKTDFNLSEYEKVLLKKANVKKLYVNVFDIGEKNGIPYLIRQTTGLEPAVLDIEFIPVVYITYEVFKNKDSKQIRKLAALIKKYLSVLYYRTPFKEVQFDYDWTPLTKQAYFNFLMGFNKDIESINSGIAISVTLRPHQFKFKESTGVPPVKKGALLCYNTGELNDLENNTIIDSRELKKYLNSKSEYPVALDIVLPVFDRIIVIKQGSAYSTEVREKSQDIFGEFKKLKNNLFMAVKFGQINDIPLEPGDLIKYDKMPLKELFKAVKIIKSAKILKTGEIILFSLDGKALKRVLNNDEKIIDIYNN